MTQPHKAAPLYAALISKQPPTMSSIATPMHAKGIEKSWGSNRLLVKNSAVSSKWAIFNNPVLRKNNPMPTRSKKVSASKSFGCLEWRPVLAG